MQVAVQIRPQRSIEIPSLSTLPYPVFSPCRPGKGHFTHTPSGRGERGNKLLLTSTDMTKSPSKLMAYHHEAIELRYQGKTYAEIAELLTSKYKRDFKDQTVRHWFSRTGMLDKEYRDYARQENERRRAYVLEELKKIVQVIPAKYQELIDRQIDNLSPGQQIYHDATKRAILKDLCALLGFKVPEEDGDRGPDALDEFFDRLEKRHDQSETNDNPK